MSRPLCRICGVNVVMSHGIDRHTKKQRLQNICTQCRNYAYKKHKKDYCEQCQFIPKWQGQLDVDHIDGDKTNNDLSNLMTLCANCHRLKTHMSREYLKMEFRANG